MARRKRTYRTPVVITLAALTPGCVPGLMADGSGGTSGAGGTPSGTGGSASGGVSSGGSASGGSASGGAPSTGGTSTGGATYGACASDGGYGLVVPCMPSDRCQTEMACTSGTNRTFVFECDESGMHWTFQAEECIYPAEFCAGTSWDEAATCQDDLWMYQGQGGNPPGPCPAALPVEDSDCSAGASFGGDRTACGYPCGDEQWTVTGCFAEPSGDPEYPYGEGTWQSDGACTDQGQGGAEP